MKTIIVRDLLIGNGEPKICVPIVSTTKNEILNDIEQINKCDHDLIELRIDYFENFFEINQILELLKEIRKIYFKPIIFTLRTKNEGGLIDINDENYFEINNYIAKCKLVDFIDIELFKPEYIIKKFIKIAHENNVKVILSNHYFLKTPAKEEILSRMLKMQFLGADITKIAVMPLSENDILTLLSASLEMKNAKGDRPFIALSMGSLGVISRVAAQLFGSCITYASLNKISAPGQLSVENTREMMRFFASAQNYTKRSE